MCVCVCVTQSIHLFIYSANIEWLDLFLFIYIQWTPRAQKIIVWGISPLQWKVYPSQILSHFGSFHTYVQKTCANPLWSFRKATDLWWSKSIFLFQFHVWRHEEHWNIHGPLRSRSKSVGAWRHTPGRGMVEVSGLANIRCEFIGLWNRLMFLQNI